MDLNFK